MSDLDVQYALDPVHLPTKAQLQHWVDAALQHAQADKQNSAQLTVRIVDVAEGAQLNEKWRHKTGATNVLSFPFETPPQVKLPLLGDIVICAPVITREAQQQDKPEQAHWAHIVVHGVLHLLGYDHIEDAQAEQMESLEIQILQHLGHPNPYL